MIRNIFRPPPKVNCCRRPVSHSLYSCTAKTVRHGIVLGTKEVYRFGQVSGLIRPTVSYNNVLGIICVYDFLPRQVSIYCFPVSVRASWTDPTPAVECVDNRARLARSKCIYREINPMIRTRIQWRVFRNAITFMHCVAYGFPLTGSEKLQSLTAH
jgi:hypothetical protein